MSGAPMYGTTAYEVSWDPGLKQYDVRMAFPVSDEVARAGLMQKLPSVIAERSRCSCGAQLEVTHQKMSLTGGLGRFKGKFRCRRCATSTRGALTRVGRSIQSVWRS